MPKSKRNKQISLTKTQKNPLQIKKHLIEQIRSSVDQYTNIFLFSVNNMRNSKLKEVREQWKHSRFFFGKNKVMALALGHSAEDDYKMNLHKISKRLKGQCGLLFTNKSSAEVLKWFENFVEADFARSGNVATCAVHLKEGPVAEFHHSLEPYLRQLGMPTSLLRGIVHLVKDFEVCKEGEILTPEKAKILELLGHQMAEFRITIDCYWSNDGSFTSLKEDTGNASKEQEMEVDSCDDEDADEGENEVEIANTCDNAVGTVTTNKEDDDDAAIMDQDAELHKKPEVSTNNNSEDVMELGAELLRNRKKSDDDIAIVEEYVKLDDDISIVEQDVKSNKDPNGNDDDISVVKQGVKPNESPKRNDGITIVEQDVQSNEDSRGSDDICIVEQDAKSGGDPQVANDDISIVEKDGKLDKDPKRTVDGSIVQQDVEIVKSPERLEIGDKQKAPTRSSKKANKRKTLKQKKDITSDTLSNEDDFTQKPINSVKEKQDSVEVVEDTESVEKNTKVNSVALASTTDTNPTIPREALPVKKRVLARSDGQTEVENVSSSEMLARRRKTVNKPERSTATPVEKLKVKDIQSSPDEQSPVFRSLRNRTVKVSRKKR